MRCILSLVSFTTLQIVFVMFPQKLPKDSLRITVGFLQVHILTLLWFGRATLGVPSLLKNVVKLWAIPPKSFSMVSGSAASRVQAKNSMIGNGFHLYSLMALLCFLPALLEAKIPEPTVCNEEASLRSRVAGTIWVDAGEVTAQMKLMFPLCTVQERVWHLTRDRLAACQLCELQAYYAWCHIHHHDTVVMAPSPLLRQDRTRVFAGLSGQRYPGNSSKGLDHLLPPGLGKEGHMEASANLPSPFCHVACQNWMWLL